MIEITEEMVERAARVLRRTGWDSDFPKHDAFAAANYDFKGEPTAKLRRVVRSALEEALRDEASPTS